MQLMNYCKKMVLRISWWMFMVTSLLCILDKQ